MNVLDLKFRAWFKDDQKMYYQIENTASSMNGLERFCQLVGSARGYTPDIMQYTGIKDNEDNDIYEGDIVEWEFLCGDKLLFVVEYWTEYNPGFWCNNIHDKNPKTIPVMLNFHGYKIVGNIHENKEMLDVSR